jgi:hypothetical protein
MLWFQFKREYDGIKRCRKMKQRQRARLDYIPRKCDTAQRRGDIGWRRGDTEEGKGIR